MDRQFEVVFAFEKEFNKRLSEGRATWSDISRPDYAEKPPIARKKQPTA